MFFLDFLADPMVLLCCNALQAEAEASSSRREGAREGSKDRREEAALAKERGACSGVLRRNLDHTNGEYLSAGRRSTETAHATWCRGRSPIQGRLLP